MATTEAVHGLSLVDSLDHGLVEDAPYYGVLSHYLKIFPQAFRACLDGMRGWVHKLIERKGREGSGMVQSISCLVY